MTLSTNLNGRVGNTPLPRKDGLLPLFEAVVNSIQSIAEANDGPNFGEIYIEILRSPQTSLPLDKGKSKRGAQTVEVITGFKITDNGVGFNDANMTSFKTLDSSYKALQGCRGVGRLLWLKAFDNVNIISTFYDDAREMKRRSFSFTVAHDVGEANPHPAPEAELKTSVHLDGFKEVYRTKSAKTVKTIATSLLEHCLWYFVRDGGAPKIRIKDDDELIELDTVFDEYMFSAAKKESIDIKGCHFELTHIKTKSHSTGKHSIAWCAASRVVEHEGLVGKVPGLHGKIREGDGDYIYVCYVTSSFLDEHVRPERIGFDIEEASDGGLFPDELTLGEIRKAVAASVGNHLESYLTESRRIGRERVEAFVAQQAPRYRPILARVSNNQELHNIDPGITDKELDLLLHKLLSEVENSLLSEGHEIMNVGPDESAAQYHARLAEYLAKASDIKMSDLASYVFHRKIILDILEQAIRRGTDGKYSKESVIHELIMPLRKTSNEVRLDSCNLWLIDERLAFHDFLASDKTLSSMPITNNDEAKEPDICALNVFDEPILFAEGQRLPLASIVIVEIKRPMRDDAAAGETKDPIEQALGYLERIREGGAQTAAGRPIPGSKEIPGFCYVLCDLTPTVERRCRLIGLTVTSDHLGWFGYNPTIKAYIEVISFDRLLNSARERNRAFFDKLGLPTRAP